MFNKEAEFKRAFGMSYAQAYEWVDQYNPAQAVGVAVCNAAKVGDRETLLEFGVDPEYAFEAWKRVKEAVDAEKCEV